MPVSYESASVTSRYAASLKPVSQVEAPGQVKWAFFTGKLWVCFSLLSVQYPGCASRLRTVIPVLQSCGT